MRRISCNPTAMLEHIPRLANKRIILASASPRRSELLQQIGLKFEVIVSTFEETLSKDNLTGAQYAAQTALHKALDVATTLKDEDFSLVIGADTVVECDGLILEKPSDAEDAKRMLSLLSGRSHAVHTGVALITPHDISTTPIYAAINTTSASATETRLPTVVFSSTTNVTFDLLSPESIDAYVETGEPFGKAGSYGIQGSAAAFVSDIQGCYFNVVGLPLHNVCKEIGKLIDLNRI